MSSVAGRSSIAGAIVLSVALLATVACTTFSVVGWLSPWVAAASLLPVVLVLGVGVFVPASGVFARTVLRGNTSRSTLALTFDDGPDPVWTPQILDLLDARRHRATFFVIGERAEQHADIVRDIARRGHEVANHTWSHSYVTALKSPRALSLELERTNALIFAETGTSPVWFRPPVGLLSPRIARAAELAGLRLVSWTATGRDGIKRTTVSQAVARLERAIVPGAILVLHDGSMGGAPKLVAKAVLTVLLDQMDSNGLRSVTLTELCSGGD